MDSPYTKWNDGIARLSHYDGVTYESSDKPSQLVAHYYAVLPGKNPASHKTIKELPQYGDQAPIAGFRHLRASNFSFDKVDSQSNAYKIEVTYTSPRGQKSCLLDSDNSGDYVSVSWGVDEITSDLCHDADGKEVINSAGDPYDTLPQKTEFVPHLTVVRREKNLPDMSLNGKVNSTGFTAFGITFDKHCARLKMQVNLIPHERPFEVTYEIIGMRNIAPAEGYGTGTVEDWGWDVPMLECGYQFYNADGVLRKFTTTGTDGIERDVSTPQLLDFDGKDARGRNPHITRYRPYNEASFDSLDFPTSPNSVIIKE